MKKTVSRWMAVPLLVLATIILLLASCSPSWFPDGERFVSIGPMGDIAIHHIATKRVTKVPPLSSQPGGVAAAVSPDGKLIAVCRVVEANERTGLQVQWRFYDDAGKLVSEKKTVKLKLSGMKKTHASEIPQFLRCDWSPDGKHILAHFPPANATFAWSMESGSIIEYKSLSSISHALVGEIGWIHHYPPCLPDSRGFLASVGGKPVIQSWDPSRHEPLKIDPSTKRIDLSKAFSADAKSRTLLSPFWEGDKMVATLGAGQFVIDTGKREFHFEDDEEVATLNSFAIKSGVLLLHRFRNGSLIGMRTADKANQIVHFDAMQKSATTLSPMEKELGFFSLSPSPRNDRLIVTIFGKENALIVVDQQGKVIYRYEGFTPTRKP